MRPRPTTARKDAEGPRYPVLPGSLTPDFRLQSIETFRQAGVAMNYQVGQEADAPVNNGDRWTFRVFLSGTPSVLAEVDRVVYTLDPIFPNPVRVSRSVSTGFKIEFTSWGTFTVKIRIVQKHGADCLQEHILTADRDGIALGDLLALDSGPIPEAMLKLAKRFKGEKAFGFAARILDSALKKITADTPPEIHDLIVQQLALCTYKDTSRANHRRLDEALTILKKRWPSLETCGDAETLGLAGAICKRKWEVDAQRVHLERSLVYYLRGYEAGKALPREDPRFECGAYPGINAAFVLDLLASEERQATNASAEISAVTSGRREKAQAIRQAILLELPELLAQQPNKKDWWRIATLIEASVGCEDFQAAAALADSVVVKEVADWELESTCLQLATLIRLRADPSTTLDDLRRSDAWRVLEKLAGGSAEAVRRAFVGKIGLALSGGGFRASLFHIGVLARLAERRVLRHIEVLSCVSGGSIIGAHYYVALRHHLQKHFDADILDNDYVQIVRDMANAFLEGVQKNIRTRVAGDFMSNVRMILQPDKYSRTERLGQLYESEIYSRIKDGEEKADRWLNDLFIQPLVETATGGTAPDEGFSPKLHNWKRNAKVPILILNATTLNTGHVWQFSASWMGEPAESINREIDANDRLRRIYYGEAPRGHQKVRLGQAVAASSSVPGLFDPIVLDKLYDDRTVRLVDGGVRDNQGIQGLFDQDCTVVLVSDASGQMGSQMNPAKSSLGVLFRTNGILQTRVRATQYDDLATRKRSALIKGMMFVHLKKGLEAETVDAAGYLDPLAAVCPTSPLERDDRTAYGITLEAQRRLAAIRTDLDSFTEVEAFALMTSGYRMTELELDYLAFLDTDDGPREEWPFLAIEDSISGISGADPPPGQVLRQLDASSKLAFKVWGLLKPLRYLARGLLALAVVALVFLLCKSWGRPLFPSRTVGWVVRTLAILALPMVLGLFLSPTVLAVVRYRETLSRILKGIALAALGWLAAWIHLLIFDRLYLHQGKVRGSARAAKPLPHSGRGKPPGNFD